MGLDKVDLMAWACVPIEAKLARESAPNKFIWTFTQGQLSKLDGLIICVADYKNRRRIFIIPAGQVKYSSKQKAERRGSLCVTIDSFDLRSQWPVYMKYEDRFDLIELERQKFMERGGAWSLLNPLSAGEGDPEWA